MSREWRGFPFVNDLCGFFSLSRRQNREIKIEKWHTPAPGAWRGVWKIDNFSWNTSSPICRTIETILMVDNNLKSSQIKTSPTNSTHSSALTTIDQWWKCRSIHFTLMRQLWGMNEKESERAYYGGKRERERSEVHRIMKIVFLITPR